MKPYHITGYPREKDTRVIVHMVRSVDGPGLYPEFVETTIKLLLKILPWVWMLVDGCNPSDVIEIFHENRVNRECGRENFGDERGMFPQSAAAYQRR